MTDIPTHNMAIFKGQDKNYIISVITVDGLKVITDDLLEFKVYNNPSESPIITKTTDTVTEINKINPTDIQVFFDVVDTSTLDVKRYYYQLWLTDGSTGKTEPVLAGYFRVQLAVPSVVEEIRSQLDEAGEVGIRQINDEILPASTLDTIYVSRGRIRSVQGVWKLTDESHSLTNYFIGGGFSINGREVTLGVNLPDLISDVRISYAWESGISDDALYDHLDRAKKWVTGYSGINFDYDSISGESQDHAKELAIAFTMLLCINTINGANVAQMGFNFRLGDFEIQTKLWGEGMIAGEIFKLYKENVTYWLSVVGKKVNFKGAKKRNQQYSLRTVLDSHQDGSVVKL